LQSVHAKRGTVAGGQWLAANLAGFKEGTRTTLALGCADEALVTEDGCGCVHPCTTVVPPLREVDKPWSYSADDKFGFKSGHALRKNKPIMRLPGPLLTLCRTTFDRGNTAGHSKRSAAAVWHDLLAGELKAKWHLRTGFSEARLKAMFSSMSQKKKGAEKVVAVPVAVAGGGGGGHDLEGCERGDDISDDVTATVVASSSAFQLADEEDN